MTEQQETSESEIKAAIEAILFAASGPVSVSQLCDLTGMDKRKITLLLQALAHELSATNRGIRLFEHEEKYQLTTAPETAPIVEAFLGIEGSQRLSRASLETLTIIAYRQPVSRPIVDQIRGVSSDYVIRGLLNRGLIQELSRAETPGRPVMYGTTADFLMYFGLGSIDDLQPFEVVEELEMTSDLRILKS